MKMTKPIAEIIDDKTIHVYDKTQFDWHAIRNCGQIFRNPPCEIIEQDDKVIIRGTDKNSAWLWNYFDLDTDYDVIKRELLGRFGLLAEPIRLGKGIRILRQPFVETVICFIISANNNIRRFEKTIAQMNFDLSWLANQSVDDFKKMGCGYRAPYLVKAISLLCQPNLVDSLVGSTCARSFIEELIKLPGVGKKVASCIALFADVLPNEQRFTICPIDVHIKRALEQLGETQADVILNHKYARVAQQYIFYYMQHLKKNFKEAK